MFCKRNPIAIFVSECIGSFKRISVFVGCIISEMNLSLLGVILVMFECSSALRFYVPANGKKCLKEEIHKNVVVTGEYELSEGNGYTSSVHVSTLLFIFCYSKAVFL